MATKDPLSDEFDTYFFERSFEKDESSFVESVEAVRPERR